jgi:hypothetical protein
MTALITVRSSRGIIGRCDAACYNADRGKCNCVCGGINHGKGRQAAAALTILHAAQILRQNEAMHPAMGPLLVQRPADLHDLAHPTLFPNDPERPTDANPTPA